MKRTTKKKLELGTETLRLLSSEDDLKLVVGGAENSVDAYCITKSTYACKTGKTHTCPTNWPSADCIGP